MNTNTTSRIITTAGDDSKPANDEVNSAYDLNLHIASIFILLGVSVLSASISVLSNQIKSCRINPIIINTGKFFGTGIVLATGFIHMLPGAMEALTDPALPDSWNDYSAYAGLFAMSAAFLMQLIEYIAHERMRKILKQKWSPRMTPSVSNNHVNVVNGKVGENSSTNKSYEENENDSHGHQHGAMFQSASDQHKISTYLLEFGIALHSVLIGVTLGVTAESFVALLVALSFHQFFEGMALGAQIARVEKMSFRSAMCMVIFFAITTPIGIAIGIGIQLKTYNPKSVASLLVNGILDSVSAGILIYVALVNLITGEMGPHATSFHALKVHLKILYFVAMYLGAATMAVIGRWV